MVVRLLVGALIGAGAGLLLGHFGKCSTGSCPLTSNYYTSVLFGTVIGLLFATSSGQSAGQPRDDERRSEMETAVERVEALSDADFEEAISGAELPVLVDIWSPWCGPCRMLAPVLERLAEKYDGQVKFYKVNAQENPQVPTNFGIAGVPTLLFFKDGELVETVVGLRDEKELSNVLDKVAKG